MEKTLYLECYTGISGDMTVAALLDLGANEQRLLEMLKTLPITGYKIKISTVKKSGIASKDFNVILDREHENNDHNMEYLHGNPHHHDNSEEEHHDRHAHNMNHGHHNHEGHYHTHEHRGLKEIIQIINVSSMTENAKKIALNIFDKLAVGEAKAHGVDVEEVHFHEVGAVDSIVDIAAVAICIDDLEINNIIVPYLCEGRGSVRCQHGVLPIPVPAVINIVKECNITIKLTEIQGELVTPTGAAIVGALCTSKKLPENFVIDKIGIGAGKRNYEQPSLLRAMFIHTCQDLDDTIVKLETNVDDCTGENLGFLMEKLFDAGARDVHYTPTYMKKNRPGYVVNVICNKEDVNSLETIIFENTSTIGIRRCQMKRSILPRSIEEINTQYGKVKVKRCSLPGGEVRNYPEYESIKKVINNNKKTYETILKAIRKEL